MGRHYRTECVERYLYIMRPYLKGKLSAKDKILELLGSVNRAGIKELVEDLPKTYFFEAQCHSHHRFDGGLAKHSLGAYVYAKVCNPHLPDESLIISCLMHDLCKIAQYPGIGRRADGRRAHGARSVALLQELYKIELTEEERLAIRWHMGRPHSSASDNERKDFRKACLCPLSMAVHASDGGDIHCFHVFCRK